MSYHYDTGSTATGFDTFDVSETVRVDATKTLLVDSFEPATLAPGTTRDGTITLSNRGHSTFTDVLGTWKAENKTLLPAGSSSTFHVDAIEPGRSVGIPVTVAAKSSATPGLYAVTVDLAYRDTGGTELTSTSTLGVEIRGADEGQVIVTVQEVEAGSVTLAATNVGVTRVTGVQIQLLPGQGYEITGREAAVLGNLGSGAFLTAEFDIQRTGEDVENLTARLRYTDRSGIQRAEVQDLGALGRATADPDAVLTVQQIESDILVLAVSNVGTEPLTGVQVHLLPSSGFEITGADTSAVGRLEPGAFGTAEFEIERTGPSLFPFRTTAQVMFTDEHGDRRTHTQEVHVAGPPQDPGIGEGNSVVLGGLALLALAAIVGLVLVLRHRRKVRQQEAAEAAAQQWAIAEQAMEDEPEEDRQGPGKHGDGG